MNETHNILSAFSPYLPYVIPALSGAVGTLAAIMGYFWVNKLRLHKIETAIGRRVLSGERRLATVHVMEECKGDITELITEHERNLEKHIIEEGRLFERIEEKVNHTNDQIIEIFKILAAWPRKGDV